MYEVFKAYVRKTSVEFNNIYVYIQKPDVKLFGFHSDMIGTSNIHNK